MPKNATGNDIRAIGLVVLIFFIGIQTYAQQTIKLPNLYNAYNDTISPIGDSDLASFARYVSAHFVVKMHYLDRKSGEEIIYVKRNWKRYEIINLTQPFYHESEVIVPQKHANEFWLKIHGNILYDMDYRSSRDTPFAERDIYQHMIQAYLDIAVKDKYPIRVFLTNRFSNSGYFKSFSALNFQFNQQQFNQQIKQAIKDKLEHVALHEDTSLLHKELSINQVKLASLRGWLANPLTLQKLVEAREATLLREHKQRLKSSSIFQQLDSSHFILDSLSKVKTPGINDFKLPSLGSLKGGSDSANKDSILKSNFVSKTSASLHKKADSAMTRMASIEQEYMSSKHNADSLATLVRLQERHYQDLKNRNASSLAQQKSNVDKINDIEQLDKKLKEEHIPDSILPKGYRKLFALRSFGIGRNLLDYSELTAKNININGIQIEYNPSYYVAIASGSVDYQFRDFVVNNTDPKQYLTVLRYGRGMKDGNNLIFSYYFGNRRLFNAATSSIQGSSVPNYKLVGYSLEGHYKLNKTNELIAEFAKSSFPYYYNQGTSKGSLLAGTIKYNERSNEAYSLKYASFLPKTATKLTVTFKRFGNNFQSYSVFTTGSSQNNWSFKVEQPFWKRRLNIVAGLNTNDFNNPYVNSGLTSTTVFKSIQATLRVNKWPIVSLGYYPSTQITKGYNNQYIENIFYTLCSSATHFYQYKGLSMNSTVSYTRFYNKPSDSGFVYFNTQNLLFNQSIFFNKWVYQASLTVSKNTEYILYVIENNCQYKCIHWLLVGAGIKYNRQSLLQHALLGYSLNATLNVNKVGSFQLLMDQGFIPGSNKLLVPNNIGRISYFKIF